MREPLVSFVAAIWISPGRSQQFDQPHFKTYLSFSLANELIVVFCSLPTPFSSAVRNTNAWIVVEFLADVCRMGT
jgi:hypothetical protein